MAAVAVLADQRFRRGLPATPGLLPQPVRRLQEGRAFRRHVVAGGALQDVAHLALQGAVVRRGAPLEAVHHVIVELSHVDRRHRLVSKTAIILMACCRGICKRLPGGHRATFAALRGQRRADLCSALVLLFSSARLAGMGARDPRFRGWRSTLAMAASIGIASPSQGAAISRRTTAARRIARLTGKRAPERAGAVRRSGTSAAQWIPPPSRRPSRTG